MTNKTRKGTVMNVEIAQRLAELRRERGFSQEGLAEQLGLSWIVLDRGFRSAVYWQAHGVQPAHDLHEAAQRLQNLP